MTCPAPTSSRGAFPTRKDCAVLALLAVWVVAFTALTWHYLMDDAYIGFTYARNLLDGHGFVFHPEMPPVEGTTNTGWVLILAAVSTVTGLGVAAKLLGAVFLFTAVALWLRIATLIFPHTPRWVLWSATILTVTSVEVMYFSVSGMETAALMLLLAVMAYLAVTRHASIWIAPVAAIAFTVRPESATVVGVYVLLVWTLCKEQRRSVLMLGVLSAALIFVVSFLRYLYFGAWVPNTFGAKPSSVEMFLGNLADSVLLVPNTVLPRPWTLLLVGVAVLGGWYAWKRSPSAFSMVAAIGIAGVLFSLYARPDWTGLSRYLAPYLPALYLLFVVGLWEVARRVGRYRRVVTVSVIVVFTIAQVSNLAVAMSPSRMDTYPGYVMGAHLLEQPAAQMGERLPADAVVASRRIGALSYFTGNPVFDYKFGLTDPTVADLIATAGTPPETAVDEALGPIWRSVRPDCIVEDSRVLSGLPRQPEGLPEGSYAIHGIVYRTSEVFPLGPDKWVLACVTTADEPS